MPHSEEQRVSIVWPGASLPYKETLVSQYLIWWVHSCCDRSPGQPLTIYSLPSWYGEPLGVYHYAGFCSAQGKFLCRRCQEFWQAQLTLLIRTLPRVLRVVTPMRLLFLGLSRGDSSAARIESGASARSRRKVVQFKGTRIERLKCDRLGGAAWSWPAFGVGTGRQPLVQFKRQWITNRPH